MGVPALGRMKMWLGSHYWAVYVPIQSRLSLDFSVPLRILSHSFCRLGYASYTQVSCSFTSRYFLTFRTLCFFITCLCWSNSATMTQQLSIHDFHFKCKAVWPSCSFSINIFISCLKIYVLAFVQVLILLTPLRGKLHLDSSKFFEYICLISRTHKTGFVRRQM